MPLNHLWLKPEHAQILADLALEGKPHEVCGLIVGHGLEAESVIPIENVANQPETHFELSPQQLAQQLPQLEKSGLEVIAIYHSHPNGEPIPSQTDICEATWENTPYLIVGCKSQQPEFAAWQIHGGRVFPVELRIGYDFPTDARFRMSPLQARVVILGGVFAVLLFVLLSLYLLPAAPTIP